MGHVIDIYNFAGGSAKTTVTLNLGYHLAQLGKRVALVDLDPQASLTEALGFDVTQIEHTVGTALEQIRETFSPIAPVLAPITSSTVFKNAGALGKPVALYDRRHDAVKTFCALAEFVITALEVDRGEE